MDDKPKTDLELRLKASEIERETWKKWCLNAEKLTVKLEEKCMNLEIKNEQLKEEIVELRREIQADG